MNTTHLVTLLTDYERSTPNALQQQHARRALTLIQTHQNTYWKRSEFSPGHITASAFVVNPEHTHALLVRHLVLHKLLQLGGHIEPTDTDIHAAALREVYEESGFHGTIMERIFDIGIHTYPQNERKHEPEHEHIDIRFLVEAPMETPRPPAHESNEVAWYPLADITHGTTPFPLGSGTKHMVLLLEKMVQNDSNTAQNSA